MEQSTLKYLCKSCNLQFKHYKQYLTHKYLQHDEERLRIVINTDDGDSSTTSSDFKSYCETNIGIKLFEEQPENKNSTDSPGDRETTLFPHGTFIKSSAMPSCSNNAEGHSQNAQCRSPSNSEDNTNELSFLLKNGQTKICNLERNFLDNTSETLMSHECNPMEIYTHGIIERLSHSQSFKSENSQIQLFRYGNNQQINVNQSPSSSSEVNQITETYPQDNRAHFAQSFEYSPRKISICEINQQSNTNQPAVSYEYCDKEFGKHGIYINRQSREIQRDVTEAHENNLMLKVISSTQHRRVNKIGINEQQYSKKNLGDLNPVDRSTIIFKESNNNEKACLDRKGVNISPITENEIIAHNKTYASNSSLKNFYVDSEKTSNNRESSESFLNKKMNPVRGVIDSKKKHGFETVEKNLGENLNTNRNLRSHIVTNLNDCHAYDKGNQKSDLLKNCVIHTVEQTVLILSESDDNIRLNLDD
ncbi:hypothetical protein TNCT_384541 [Trichonephila clavata]|uniref:C2H2-type domain-containing protein n=1 Tax=Trichonephila clavata TaxID=2740835 RepID=A0A8X6LNF2_TRICU|nr:hypothetical protein TNCT_384541 [Trichonephila clavata]